jgi:hypothetical protein
LSLANIRTQIKAILEAVTGIGPVHDYYRWTRSLSEFLDLMKDANGKLNGWEFQWEDDAPERKPIGPGKAERNYTFTFRGYYDLDDETGSRKDFEALIDSIFMAFLGNQNLNGSCHLTGLFTPQTITDAFLEGNKESAFCHQATATLLVTERISV